MKNKWEKPSLVILQRGRPQESVLNGCKKEGSAIHSGNTQNGCDAPVDICSLCMSEYGS